MKPAWDQLIDEYKTSKSVGVYDVDCTTEGRALCEEVGVQGYPSIKYGDPSDKKALSDYEGGRDFESLKKFTEENFGPVCNPDALDACDEEQRAQLESFLKKSSAELGETIKKLEKDFSDKTKKLSKKLSKLERKQTDFDSENSEFKADKELYEADKTKFEKKGDKATASEKKKHEEKAKKMKKLEDKINKKKGDLRTEREALDKEKAAIDEDVKKSGVKFMKLAIKKVKKDEL
eukprot:TRINITY_DN3590_c0_g1_i1.p1 TRINITY_DN3590_c0_g1~~TRINITY_DN3590_c0_g1_i1.p1  ORF type:complete len:234 (+),score=112.44 TRINITY_DN3590_c0_g1_i1:220-921(+)